MAVRDGQVMSAHRRPEVDCARRRADQTHISMRTSPTGRAGQNARCIHTLRTSATLRATPNAGQPSCTTVATDAWNGGMASARVLSQPCTRRHGRKKSTGARRALSDTTRRYSTCVRGSERWTTHCEASRRRRSESRRAGTRRFRAEVGCFRAKPRPHQSTSCSTWLEWPTSGIRGPESANFASISADVRQTSTDLGQLRPGFDLSQPAFDRFRQGVGQFRPDSTRSLQTRAWFWP